MKVRPKSYSSEVRARAKKLFDEGVSQAQSARELGVHHTTIARWSRDWRSSSEQGASVDPTRNPDGTFKKGVSGNPGGTSSARERALRMAEEAAPAMILKMIEEAEKAVGEMTEDEARAQAVLHRIRKELLDRGLGKATQKQEIKHDLPTRIVFDIGKKGDK